MKLLRGGADAPGVATSELVKQTSGGVARRRGSAVLLVSRRHGLKTKTEKSTSSSLGSGERGGRHTAFVCARIACAFPNQQHKTSRPSFERSATRLLRREREEVVARSKTDKDTTHCSVYEGKRTESGQENLDSKQQGLPAP